MFEIVNDKIKITKGDSAVINVELENYTMNEGDTLTLTVRKKVNGHVLMQVVSNDSTLNLTPDKTKNLQEGACFYDIELKTASNEVYTIAGVTDATNGYNMLVYPEITE